MIYILMAAVILLVASCVLLYYSSIGYGLIPMISAITGVLGLGACAIIAILFVTYGFGWLAAEHKAKIINREYKANYTQAEVFYASDVIDTVRELDRKRYEVNGDLMKPKE